MSVTVVAARLAPYRRWLPSLGGRPRAGWLLSLEDSRGRVGRGDAACWPGFGSGAARTERALRDLVRDGSLLGRTIDSIDDVAALGLPRREFPEASHAVELAALDLLGRAHGRPVAALLEPHPAEAVPVHALVDGPEDAARAAARGLRHLKLKVGRAPLAEDAARLAAVRAAAPACALRLDANGAWATPSAALRALDALGRDGVEWVEQPLPAGKLAETRRLRRRAGVSLALDEDAATAPLAALADAADVVVLKPMFLGGLLAALRRARDAAHLGLDVCVTHALESAVGRAGALHLAASLSAPRACGLLSPYPEEPDGPRLRDGLLAVPPSPGLGVDASAPTPGLPSGHGRCA